MKNLSTQEKAKAYDEVRMKIKLRFGSNVADEIFLPFEESEDGRIRKVLVNYFKSYKNQCTCGSETFNGVSTNNIIAWLEKQGKIVDYYEDRLDECACKYFDKGYKHALEKQGEQKPDDKVEPKFKVGDWCIDNEDGTIFQIVKVLDNTYTYKTNEGKEYSCTHYSLENDVRPWTIQDAKSGDVLACPNDAGDRDVVFIFKNINRDEGWVFCFCASDANGCFCTNNDYVGNSNSTNISPATKEQCDLLFQKMKETGYEWDAEKKELKKVEQKPTEEYNITGISSNKSQGKLGEIIKNLKTTWSEKDEVGLANAMWAIEQARTIAKDENDMGNLWYAERWLKSLKDRVGCEVNCTTTKEWSEEDESILQGIWDEILANKHQAKEYEWKTYDRFLSWLKSLRHQNRWKPSEHEITVLEKIQHGEINPSNPTLHRVIKCLKKLMEE